VLSDGEIQSISELHFNEHYRPQALSAAARPMLQLIRVCVLDNPPGVYYGVRMAEPEEGLLLGDGGFFVDRRDGGIHKFGSGDVAEACRALEPRHNGIPTMQVTPAVVQFLLEHIDRRRLASHSKRWWQIWR